MNNNHNHHMPLSKNMQIHDIMNSYLNNDKVTLNLNNFKFKHRCSFHISVFSSSSSLSSFFFFLLLSGIQFHACAYILTFQIHSFLFVLHFICICHLYLLLLSCTIIINLQNENPYKFTYIYLWYIGIIVPHASS